MPTDTLDRPLYDTDFERWTHDQAARLRAAASLRRNEPIDWELLAEEIEALGRSERRACESYVELILAHLLKLQFSSLSEPRGHWRGEVAAFRAQLAKLLTPTLTIRLESALEEHYRIGRRLARERLIEDDAGIDDRLPPACPYVFEDVVGDWLPPRA